MYLLLLSLWAWAGTDLSRCGAGGAHQVAIFANRPGVDVEPDMTLGLSTIIYQGTRVDESNLLPEADGFPPVKPIFLWDEKSKTGLIIDQKAGGHVGLKKMLPKGATPLGGVRYSWASGGVLTPTNSTTFQDEKGKPLPSMELQDRYFDVRPTRTLKPPG